MRQRQGLQCIQALCAEQVPAGERRGRNDGGGTDTGYALERGEPTEQRTEFTIYSLTVVLFDALTLLSTVVPIDDNVLPT